MSFEYDNHRQLSPFAMFSYGAGPADSTRVVGRAHPDSPYRQLVDVMRDATPIRPLLRVVLIPDLAEIVMGYLLSWAVAD